MNHTGNTLSLKMLALAACICLGGCGAQSKPIPLATPVVRSVVGTWTTSGAAKGLMEFEKSGLVRAGRKGHMWDMGKWSLTDDDLTLTINGTVKNARVKWSNEKEFAMVPLDAKGEGPPVFLRRAE